MPRPPIALSKRFPTKSSLLHCLLPWIRECDWCKDGIHGLVWSIVYTIYMTPTVQCVALSENLCCLYKVDGFLLCKDGISFICCYYAASKALFSGYLSKDYPFEGYTCI